MPLDSYRCLAPSTYIVQQLHQSSPICNIRSSVLAGNLPKNTLSVLQNLHFSNSTLALSHILTIKAPGHLPLPRWCPAVISTSNHPHRQRLHSMTEQLEQTTLIPQGPSDKEKKYDRQLRLWAASGQAALESANLLLINSGAGTVGIETLKNLVLPGLLVLYPKTESECGP